MSVPLLHGSFIRLQLGAGLRMCVFACVCVRVCVGAELHEWGIFSFSWSEAVKRVYSRGDFSPCRSTMLLLWAQDNWLQLMTRTLRNQLKQWALQRENYSHTAACMSSSFRYDTEFYQTCQEHLQVIFHHMIKRKKEETTVCIKMPIWRAGVVQKKRYKWKYNCAVHLKWGKMSFYL